MKNQFQITGLFYKIKEYKFRKYLNIKKENSNLNTPDLMVIMMNPGSSRPIDGIDNNTLESEAIPDNTQTQIMKVMLNCGFKYARILNLSDVREPKSNIFYKKIKEMEVTGIAHSIFDDARKKDFNKLWVKNVPVIYAWGVNQNLKELALNAIKACNSSSVYGILKPSAYWAYYHPLPPNYKMQKIWIKKISKKLKKNNLVQNNYIF